MSIVLPENLSRPPVTTAGPLVARSGDVIATVNPLDTREVFVQLADTSPLLDLPRALVHVPESLRYPLHRFEPAVGRWGAWVLRSDVRDDHTPRVWGTADHWGCVCVACENYRDARHSLTLAATGEGEVR